MPSLVEREYQVIGGLPKRNEDDEIDQIAGAMGRKNSLHITLFSDTTHIFSVVPENYDSFGARFSGRIYDGKYKGWHLSVDIRKKTARIRRVALPRGETQ